MSTPRGRGGRRGSSGTQQRGARGTSTARGAFNRGNVSRGSQAPRGFFGRGSATLKPSRGAPFAPKTQGFDFTSPAVTHQAGNFKGGLTREQWSARYEELQRSRAKERQQAIRQGLTADPDKPRSLAEAITPVGTCQDMCAEYERAERVVQNDVWKEEEDQNHSVYSSASAQPDESRMVKKFRRAAAGLEEQLPSDLRPPAVLKRTCDYLFDEVVGNAERLEKVHHFVWDRTRAIRNDFSIQQLSKLEELRIAVECYERIARFHILSLHLLAVQPKPYDQYDAQQEREQLDRTLLSLMQYYDDCRGRIELPNEAEFRAYCVIFQLQDPVPDLEDRAQSWPSHILRDRRVQTGLQLYAAACNTADSQGPFKQRASALVAQQDWQRFWMLIESKAVSYLMGCVAEIYFNLVRRTTLSTLYHGYKGSGKSSRPSQDWTIHLLLEAFAFDEEEQLHKFCNAYGFSIQPQKDENDCETGTAFLNLHSVNTKDLTTPDLDLPKQWKSSLVEEKRFGRTLPAIINGLTAQQARQAGLVNEEEREEEMDDAIEQDEVKPLVNGKKYPFEEDNNDSDPVGSDEDSLFVRQDEAQPKEHEQSLTNGVSAATNPFAPNTGAPSGGSFSFGKPSTGTFGQPFINSEQQTIKPAEPPAPAAPPQAPKMDTFDFAKVSPPATQPTAPSTSGDSLFSSHQAPLTAFTPGTFSFGGGSTKPALDSDSNSVFSKPPPIEDIATSQLFSFNKPARGQAPAATTAPEASESKSTSSIFSNFKPAAVESAPTSPDKPFVFGQSQSTQPTAAGAATSPPSPENKGETKAPLPHFNFPSASQPAASNNQPPPEISPQRRVSQHKKYDPRHKSPLSQSFGPESEGAQAVNGVRAPNQLTKAASAEASVDSEALFTRLANELFGDEHHGVLSQFIDFTIGQAITEAQELVLTEKLIAEADEFRRRSLQVRYWKIWRDVIRKRKSAKRGSARRERARRGLEDLRSGRSSRRSSVAGSSAVFGQGKKEMVDSMFQQTVRNGQRPNFMASEAQAAAGSKRPIASQGVNGLTSIREPSHKRQKSTSHVDEHSRVTKPAATDEKSAELLKRSSFLGFSLANQRREQGSATRSNYFRAKALGVDQANLSEPRGTKRRLSQSTDSASKASPPPSWRNSLLKSSPDQPSRKVTSMPPPSFTPKKDDADEALFARLKAAREGLAESGAILKSAMEKNEERRKNFDDFQRSQSSLSNSQSSTDSLSMIRARAEARLRAGQAGAAATRDEVPAYRLRESRFVPRDQYGKALERARALRESRSRETSRPQSRFDESWFDETPQKTIPTPADTQSQNVQAPNGSLYPSLPQWQPPSTVQETNVFSSVPAQASWEFGNADAQPPQKEPDVFGQPPESDSFLAFQAESQPAQQQGVSANAVDPAIFSSFNDHFEKQAAQPESAFAKPTEPITFSSLGKANGPAESDTVFSQSTQDKLFGFTNSQPSAFGNAFTLEASKPSAGFGWHHAQSVSQPEEPHDFTIQPSQVEQSLSNSFGHAQGFDQELLQHAQQEAHSPTPQPDSFQRIQPASASEAISLLSDDGEDEHGSQPAQPAYVTHLAQQALANGVAVEGQSEDEQLFVQGDEDEVPDSYQYSNVNNPYAALADDYAGGDTEENTEDEPQDEQIDDKDAYAYDGDRDPYQAANGFYAQKRYDAEDDEDDIEADGDVEDAADDASSSISDDDEDGDEQRPGFFAQRGFTSVNREEEEEFEGYSEDGEEYTSEEDDEDTQGEEFNAPNGVWNKAPSPPNPALQGVGGTAEEAIELSD